MKFIVILLAVLVASTCVVKGYHGDQVLKKCMAENGVNENEPNNGTAQEEPDHNMKCAYACVFRELKLTNKNGLISQHRVDLIIAVLKHQVSEINECFENFPHHKDKCDASYELDGCLKKAGLTLHSTQDKNHKAAEKDLESK